MTSVTIKTSSFWTLPAVLLLAGVTLSGCSGLDTNTSDAENVPVRVEIHDSRGLLKGRPVIGGSMMAVPICPSGKCTATFEYQWFAITRSGTHAIEGANAQSYTPSLHDLTSQFFVRVRTK
ncbi:hypothetical protein ACIQVE_02045 [Pseudomonas sp. NPDC098747]|uniref:hypothetical protein n=1 Tax=Pseudomonas sp. NPDC098747 TaxID=3364487 RepID=UPI00383A4368